MEHTDLRHRPAFVNISTPADLPLALRDVRHQAGLSQADLAELLGVSRMTVSRMERGEPSSNVTMLRALFACGFRVVAVPRDMSVRIERAPDHG